MITHCARWVHRCAAGSAGQGPAGAGEARDPGGALARWDGRSGAGTAARAGRLLGSALGWATEVEAHEQ